VPKWSLHGSAHHRLAKVTAAGVQRERKKKKKTSEANRTIGLFDQATLAVTENRTSKSNDITSLYLPFSFFFFPEPTTAASILNREGVHAGARTPAGSERFTRCYHKP
jgi:hypothetical protein